MINKPSSPSYINTPIPQETSWGRGEVPIFDSGLLISPTPKIIMSNYYKYYKNLKNSFSIFDNIPEKQYSQIYVIVSQAPGQYA